MITKNGNPIDITGGATPQMITNSLWNSSIADKNVDIVMPWFVFQDNPR